MEKVGRPNAYELNLDDLTVKYVTKSLKSFIDKLTDRAVYKTEYYNCKATFMKICLKLRSGKSMHSSHVFSEQGVYLLSRLFIFIFDNNITLSNNRTFVPVEREHSQFWKKSS
jgi:hypothetical protein